MNIALQSIFSFHQLGLRDNQEDSRYPDEDRPLPKETAPFFIVCDGVGGNEKGEVASSTICQSFANSLRGRNWSKPFGDDDLKKVLLNAYGDLAKKVTSDNRDMATTLTFVAFHGNGCLVAHIGDSRIYQIRPNDGIMYRSDDHSLVNAMLRSGNITPDEFDSHPQNNIITRCISASGERYAPTVLNIRNVAPNDYFLLCTDGVTHAISENDLIDLLSSDLTDEEKFLKLSKHCENSDDNNTAILIHIADVEVDVTEADEKEAYEAEHPGTQPIRTHDDSVHDVDIKPTSLFGKLKSLFYK